MLITLEGNGTQAIAWQINEESYRKRLEAESGAPSDKPGLQVYYGSIHDILSYPCEDGKPELVQAASVSIHGPHGQHIENVHLQPYTSQEDFWGRLYVGPYARLLERAGAFLDNTGGAGDDALVFIRSVCCCSITRWSLTNVCAVVVSTPANTNILRCHDTSARFQCRSITASHGILAHSRSDMPRDDLSVY